MFAKIIESEIEWCEQNNGTMPEEFRKGFVAGLKQSIYLINATKQRMVWQDGEMVDDDDLLDRAAELPREAVSPFAGAEKPTVCGCLQYEGNGKLCSYCNRPPRS